MTLTQERPAAVPKPMTEDAETEAPPEEVPRPRHWATAEYYALGDAGFFDDERLMPWRPRLGMISTFGSKWQ